MGYKEAWICDMCGDEIEEMDDETIYKLELEKMDYWNEFSELLILKGERELCKECLIKRLKEIIELLKKDCVQTVNDLE